MITRKILIPLPLVFLVSCFLFNVTSMNQGDYSFIKKGEGVGQVSYKIDEFGLDELTCQVFVYDDKICLVDNVLGRIQVMDPEGEVGLILGATANTAGREKITKKFNFGTIGALYMDDEGTLYVQNIVSNQGSGADFSPSYILVFNRDGQLQYTLGQTGAGAMPFYQIEYLDVDSDGRLMVISRTFDSWSVYSFKGKNRNYMVNLNKLDFTEKEDNEVYTGKIENVKMYSSGDRFLISVDFYQGLRLKYRKVFVYSARKNRIEKTLLNIPDPKNVLFSLVDDKLIYFWNMDSEVKFAVYNHDGNIVSNIKLEIAPGKFYYSKIIEDRKGNIYSYHIGRDGIQVLQWE